jgi:hypothetical protein
MTSGKMNFTAMKKFIGSFVTISWYDLKLLGIQYRGNVPDSRQEADITWDWAVRQITVHRNKILACYKTLHTLQNVLCMKKNAKFAIFKMSVKHRVIRTTIIL